MHNEYRLILTWRGRSDLHVTAHTYQNPDGTWYATLGHRRSENYGVECDGIEQLTDELDCAMVLWN